MKYFPTAKQSGFSLVETLVSITILLIVIVGPMSISTSTARSTSYSSEQVVAFFLAQEGAEIVQKARDDLILLYFSNPQVGWDSFSDDTSGAVFEECFTSSGCGLELDNDPIGSVINRGQCTGSVCDLYYDSSGLRERFTHESSGNADTLYTRTIKLVANGDEVSVVSTVQWRTGSQRKVQEVVIESYLYNVYGN